MAENAGVQPVRRGGGMTAMTQSEFARHMGWDRSRVTQLKNAGRLVMANGKVDVEASQRLIAETSDPGKAAVSDRHAKARPATPTPPAPSIQDELNQKAGSAYQQARAVREKYAAMQARIAYEKEVGDLIETTAARMAVMDGDAVVRNRLEAMPDILAPQLAAETDEGKIRAVLIDHVETLLADLSRTFSKLIGG